MASTPVYCLRCLALVGVLAAILPGASAISAEAAVIASSAVAVFMLLIVIASVVYAVSANSWIKSAKKSNGKLKMPRSYFQKKREIKYKIAAESMRSRTTQDTYVVPPAPMRSPLPPVPTGVAPAMNNESSVHVWNTESKKYYEEKGCTVELGDEKEDEEFHIETTLVDNEVLDVGPYQSVSESASAQPVDGNVYSKPYLFTNQDRVTVSKSVGMVSSGTPTENGIASPIGQSNDAFVIEDKLIRL